MVSRVLAAVHNLSGNQRGMVLMFIAMIGTAISQGMVRQVSAELHTFQIVFLTTLTGLPVLLPWFLRHGFAPFRTTRFSLHLVRTLIVTFQMTAWYYAIAITPLANASALGFSTPIFATLLAIIVLGEKVGTARWFAVFLGITGMLVILQPGLTTIELGPILAVTAALSRGVVIIITKILSRTDSSVTILAYVMVLFVPLSLIQALLVWHWPSQEAFMWLVGIGVIGTTSALMMTQAIKVAETSVIMPLFFFQLIWMSIIGFAFYGEIPSVFAWIGGAMIIGSATFIAYRETRAKRTATDAAG